MNKLWTTMVILAMTWFWIGCSPTPPISQVTMTPPKTPLATYSRQEMSKPTLTLSATSTPTLIRTLTPSVMPSPTTTITPTPKVDEAELLQRKELEYHETLPFGEMTGTLVLSGNFMFGPFAPPEKKIEGDSYYLDLQTGDKIVFSPKGDRSLTDFTVSPNHQWLAYYKIVSASEHNIVITASGGKNEITIPLEEHWGNFTWLNDEYLVIRKNIRGEKSDIRSEVTKTGGGEAKRFAVVFLNPFTGQRQEQAPEYPNMYSIDPLFSWPVGYMIFNSTMTRVIYPKMWDEHLFSLWDLQTNQNIADIQYGEWPRWSPVRGGPLAWIVDVGPDVIRDPWYAAEEMFLLDQNGQITRLTNLTQQFHYVHITSYSWSPDGRHIAAWISISSIDPNSPFYLAQIDTQTGQTTIYDIQPDFQEGGSTPDYMLLTSDNDTSPIWSPDGKHLLVNAKDPSDNQNRFVMIVDLEGANAYKVAENMIAVGWMVSAP